MELVILLTFSELSSNYNQELQLYEPLTSFDFFCFSFLPQPFLHPSSPLSEGKKYQRSTQHASYVFIILMWGLWQSIWVPSAGCLSVFIFSWTANIPAMPHRAPNCAEYATMLHEYDTCSSTYTIPVAVQSSSQISAFHSQIRGFCFFGCNLFWIILPFLQKYNVY